MRLKDFLVALVAVALLMPAAVGAGEQAVQQYKGKILIDISSHGEAWYVNPQSMQRVYLGTPDQALYELTRRATLTAFANIEKIGLDGQESPDPAYAAQMAGYIVAPNDLHGAAWYVHPVLKTRYVLATPHDAWNLMRGGLAVSTATLKLIPEEGYADHDPKGMQKVKSVKATDLLELEDGTEVRLMSVDAPDNAEYQQAAVAMMSKAIQDNDSIVRLDHDVTDTDSQGRKLRMVSAGDIILNLMVVREGWAFHDVTPPNFMNAEQMIVAGLDAEKNQKGFWNK